MINIIINIVIINTISIIVWYEMWIIMMDTNSNIIILTIVELYIIYSQVTITQNSINSVTFYSSIEVSISLILSIQYITQNIFK